MADTSQGRVTPEIDDDPFAELTRIMGFDPRQPIRRDEPAAAAPPEMAAAPPAPRHQAPVVDANDLEIDLERELMGEFSGAPDELEVWEPQAAHPDPVVEHHEFEPVADPVRMSHEPVHFEAPEHGAPDDGHQGASYVGDAHVDAQGDDWEIDLADELLSGAELAAEAAPAAHPAAMSAPVAAWAAHAAEPVTQVRGAVHPVMASRENFASNVELPPIPLGRPAEAVIHPPEPVAHDDALDHDFNLALEQELGGALASPLEDDWDRAAAEDFDGPASPAPVAGNDFDHAHVEAAEEPNAGNLADGHDPYAALAALSTGLHARSHADAVQAHSPAVAGHADAPDIETVEVPEQSVPVAEELDIPEIHFEEHAANASGYDDIDAEFANLLNEMNAMDRTSEQPAQPAWQPSESAAPIAPIVIPAAMATAETGRRYAVDADYLANAQASEAELADMEFAFDPDAPEDMAPTPASPRKPRRGYIIAAAVAGVAVLGGVAAYVLPFGGSGGGDEIALVKADPSPNKVRPENPGGVEIPNQHNKVYDRVSGAGGNESPTQEKLLQSAEEPVDLPMLRDDDMAEFSPFPGDVEGDATAEAAVKGEDRIAQSAGDQGVDTTMEVAAVPPRKVRTMIVKADGSLVAREVPVEEAALQADEEAAEFDPVAAATAEAEEPVLPEAAAGIAEEPIADQPAPAAAAPSATTTASTPSAAPIAPSRPSDQPVDIVGEVQPTEVAALAPAAGAWSVQIASQPSEAAAQASLRDLQRKHASVLDGRPTNIVKADIPGKGTFWRVRVGANTRAEAVKLCETYKSAGGSCFVSR